MVWVLLLSNVKTTENAERKRFPARGRGDDVKLHRARPADESSMLIPSVSALESRQSGGQSAGLAAGANVLTVNFTPIHERGNYLIYGKDRYIVRNDHVNEIVAKSGLQRSPSVFV